MLSRKDLIETLAANIATDLFISMLNPTLRGAQFSYTAFDIARHVQAMIGTNLATPPSKAEEKRAGEVARRTWDRWCKRAGDGLPLPLPLPLPRSTE
jgi:hypothetical protein